MIPIPEDMFEEPEIKDSGERTWNGKYNKVGDKRGCAGTHNMSDTVLYSRWCDMKRRCYNKQNKRYSNYGGRGIKVCDEWKNNFESFYIWAVNNGFQQNLSLDRIDVNGDYEPNNCRWSNAYTQMNNTSRNHYLTVNGETKTISEWGREKGINPDVIKDRLTRLHWSAEEAVSIPTMRRGGKRWLLK